jgi:tetratricopeptide (TPR) repeat protein
MARMEALPPDFFRDHARLRRLYRTLHGNGRGLTFFAAAVQGLSRAEEEVFLEKLAQAEAEIQLDMALDRIVGQLSPLERAMLERLPAFPSPVPIEGLIKLGLDLAPASEDLLQRLLAVSLLEQQYDHDWHSYQYQCPPLVVDWLQRRGVPAPSQTLLQAAADYQHYLYRRERRTLSQALTVHQALHSAGQVEAAHRFALDRIVGPLNRRGFFHTLIKEWLPDMCQAADRATRAEALGQTGKQYLHIGKYETALTYLKQALAIQQEIGDKAGEGTTLNNISQIYDARGDYETALTYLKQSLAIQQQIGDKAGLCATLFNMGHIHWQNEEVPQAISAWVTVYQIATALNLAQALDALENLANGLGLPGGLDGWAELVRQMEES